MDEKGRIDRNEYDEILKDINAIHIETEKLKKDQVKQIRNRTDKLSKEHELNTVLKKERREIYQKMSPDKFQKLLDFEKEREKTQEQLYKERFKDSPED